MISVIIPTYNRKDKLKRALKSVLNQTLKDIEIIIVDNGSTDGTIEFLNGIYDKRIRYYINKQSGANFSRNLGIEKSKRDYIAFLDDDDEWECTKLEKQKQILDMNTDIGLCYTGKKIIYEEYKISYNSYSPKKKNIYLENFIGTTSSVMIRKVILEKSGKFDVILPALQDYELWIRVLKYTKSYEIKEPLINYYISSNNNQISNSIIKFEEALKYIYLKNKDNLLFLKNYQKRKLKIEEEIILRKIREGHNVKTKEIKSIKNKIKAKMYSKINIEKMLYLKKVSSKIIEFNRYLNKVIKNENKV